MHKKIFLIFSFLFILVNLLGQNKVSGKIIEAQNQQPVEYASITIHNAIDSSMITGVVTDANGFFQFTSLTEKQCYVEAQFLGYDTYRSAIFDVSNNYDLGIITLGANSAMLSEVEVTGRAITNLHQLDKQVYDAKQFKNAQGGTASDVLRNLPSISINSFGEISFRGATGFIVMINGRPVQADPAVILGQLPANAIEDIEVITAPSAKYDPDGKAGIINIKTKRAVSDGFYVSANLLLGLPSIEPYDNKAKARRYGADVNFNYKKEKIDLSLALDYRNYDRSGRRVGYVNTYLNEVLTEFPSYGERSFDTENYAARAAVVFTPSKQQSIGASFYAGKRTKYRTADILYDSQQRVRISNDAFLGTEAYWDSYDQTGQVFNGGTRLGTNTFYNENLRVRKGDFLIGGLDYSFKFDNQSTLKLSALYERTILGGPTDNVSLSWPNFRDTFQLQFNTNDNPLDGFRFQTDYSIPFENGHQLDVGYQFRFLKHPGDFLYLDRDFETNTWVENPLFTNRIELRRSIHSVYSQLSGAQDKWQYTIGLRMEYFDRQVDIAKPDTLYTLDQFNLFPSVNLQYSISEQTKLKAGYSRRIERTTTFKMTPFPEREHSETLEQGDAALLPELIDLAELGVVHSWEDNTLFATGYFRKVDNVINRVNSVFNDTILNRIYTNAGQATVWGLELGATLFPSDWSRLYLGTNIYNYRIKGQLFDDQINTANTIYSINANADFKLAKTWSLQLGLNYLSERVTAQGRDSRFYNPNLTLRKTFYDKKLSVSFQWLNIDMGLLSSNEQRITTVRNNFFTTTNYIYEVDILQLSVSYQLNAAGKKLKLIKSEFGDKEF